MIGGFLYGARTLSTQAIRRNFSWSPLVDFSLLRVDYRSALNAARGQLRCQWAVSPIYPRYKKTSPK